MNDYSSLDNAKFDRAKMDKKLARIRERMGEYSVPTVPQTFKFLPCPFCGEKKLINCFHVPNYLWTVSCGKCDAAGPYCDTDQQAADAWNKRK